MRFCWGWVLCSQHLNRPLSYTTKVRIQYGVMLKNGNSIVKDAGVDFFMSKPGDQKQFNIDITKPSTVDIWFQYPTQSLNNPKAPLRKTDLSYRLSANKNLFFTYDVYSYLRPETGTVWGLSGKTKSGLRKGNIVSDREIEAISSSMKPIDDG